MSAAGGAAKADIGKCNSVTVTCVSELGWFDDSVTMGDVIGAGGMDADQWGIAWTEGNGAGSCNLVEVEGEGGQVRRILVDCGWDPDYISARLKDTGVDKMIADGQVDMLYMSHEHMDHFWGLEAVLGLKPDIKIVVPSTFSQRALDFIAGKEKDSPGARNSVAHSGELEILQPGQMYKLMDGVGTFTFDVPIILGVNGEQSLYFDVQGKGVIAVTGCCHQGVLELLDLPAKLMDGARLYGVYGGLHVAPFGDLQEEQAQLIGRMAEMGLKKVAANHCTGLPAIKKMIEVGMPVQSGSGSGDSKSDLHPGAGDKVVF